jgi:oligopeptide transport system ATP-binding protein
MILQNNIKYLLEVNNLRKYFPLKKGLMKRTMGYVSAVDCVNLFINKKEALGLVGESGCGKSTIGKCILRLHTLSDGKIMFEGNDIALMDGKKLKAYRKKVQAIFQDPYSSLNPRMTVQEIIGEPLEVHKIKRSSENENLIEDILNKVGLRPECMTRYPHEFSGGQRQRIEIARALVLKPSLIVCDEPVSALDVSVQAQVINLLDDLKEEFNLSYLFIAHDLGVVEHISDRIAVMYLGKIVELAKDIELINNAMHPYTQALVSSIPNPDIKRKKKRIILKGEVPSAINPPSGCTFHTRCFKAVERCGEMKPQLHEVSPGHYVSCLLID